jgi:DNA polymerase
MATREAFPTAAPFVPPEHKLPVLVEAMPACKGCDLYKHATQVVPGAGTSRAHLMLVGEQPGNEEDKQGEPFVGPARGVLRRAMNELHIKPAEIYVTNAVKHFKFVQRGKLRLHKNPRMSEINACRPWLQAEIDAVKPRVVLCLGASAAKSLLGSTFSVMKDRGKILEAGLAKQVIATIHPSAILRNRDEQDHERLYHYLVDDLALAYSTAMGKH